MYAMTWGNPPKLEPTKPKQGKGYDLTGEVFEYLTALELIGSKHGKSLWKCVCKCEKEVKVISTNLLRETTKSCGCWIKRNQIIRC